MATGSRQPSPAPGPGAGLTPKQLFQRWSNLTYHDSVIGFFGSYHGMYRCFSNFYDQNSEPFDFEVPNSFFTLLGGQVPGVVRCDFSEKAIMLCKAAVMGDVETYHEIMLAKDPRTTKALGRRVKRFNHPLWEYVVCSVAYEVVHQKFTKTRSIQRVLWGTGEHLIAEATRNDSVWGIGIDTDDERVQTPREWRGCNVLGWALMEVRDSLRRCQVALPTAQVAEAAWLAQPVAAAVPAAEAPPRFASFADQAGRSSLEQDTPTGDEGWSAYLDPDSGRLWFWKSSTDEGFFAEQPPEGWSVHEDDSKRRWWCNQRTQERFWEENAKRNSRVAAGQDAGWVPPVTNDGIQYALSEVATAYDARELGKNGQPELGYLELTAGDRVTHYYALVEKGHDFSSARCYYFGFKFGPDNEYVSRGWFPCRCVRHEQLWKLFPTDGDPRTGWIPAH